MSKKSFTIKPERHLLWSQTVAVFHDPDPAKQDELARVEHALLTDTELQDILDRARLRAEEIIRETGHGRWITVQ